MVVELVAFWILAVKEVKTDVGYANAYGHVLDVHIGRADWGCRACFAGGANREVATKMNNTSILRLWGDLAA